MSLTKANSFILSLILATLPVLGSIPPVPVTPRLVNDYTSLLTAGETQQLEELLVAYDDSTTTQICVVIVNDLDGQDILNAAYEIGEQWGVGHSKFSNGVVLLIKNKTVHSRGEVAIATGYGTEGALTDALCRRIIKNDIIPMFSQENYYQGILQAVLHIQSILSGENYGSAQEDELTFFDIIVILLVVVVFPIILIIMLVRYEKKHPEKFRNRGSGGGFWISGGNSHNGGFSGGGHSSFGGFGGGHFGGGGARGGW